MTDSEFDRFVSLYRKNVRQAALCTVKNSEDAEDISQDVFLKLYVSDIIFESDEHVKAWLIRCALNAGKNLLKARQRRGFLSLDDVTGYSADKVREDNILPAVMQLGEKQRTAMYLHFYEGYSVDETAKILGISKSAVNVRISVGKKKLREMIESERRICDGI